MRDRFCTIIKGHHPILPSVGRTGRKLFIYEMRQYSLVFESIVLSFGMYRNQSILFHISAINHSLIWHPMKCRSQTVVNNY